MQGQNYNPYTGAPLSGIDPPAGYPQKSRIAAGLFGMLMGTFGVHNFYLGNTQRGLIQILVATLGAPLTCGLSTVAVWVWSLVEGVQILEGKGNTAQKSRRDTARSDIIRPGINR